MVSMYSQPPMHFVYRPLVVLEQTDDRARRSFESEFVTCLCDISHFPPHIADFPLTPAPSLPFPLSFSPHFLICRIRLLLLKCAACFHGSGSGHVLQLQQANSTPHSACVKGRERVYVSLGERFDTIASYLFSYVYIFTVSIRSCKAHLSCWSLIPPLRSL